MRRTWLARSGAGALAFALALLVVGCGDLPNPLATPVPPDALHPNRPIVAVNPALPPVTPDPAKAGKLAQHRARWDSLHLADYTLGLLYGCQCPLGGGKPVEITVAGGRITSASYDGEALAIDRLIGFPATVEDLFAYAERNGDAGKIELKFDERYGLPTAIGIDPDLAARDDEVRVVVTSFDPAP